jgi:chromosome segregation protein
MYLKQIELENFKSFGKKMSIPLMNGFTAVTGPNGSGKSNISDAILFVLGPKSSKALRAAKLTDLIFNGGNDKQPATYCKVSLVFDNADRLIPIDADTVRLTRHVKLAENDIGYNSYFFVNERKSTLTEFDYLLASARISAEGYNVVQQGDVTRITTMSPMDRRKILEDISGISKYDEEMVRAETEKKQADENIDKVAFILSENGKQLSQLELERAAALKYLETRSKVSAARSRMAHKRREMAEAETLELQEKVSQIGKEIEGARSRRIALTNDIEAAERRVADLDRQIEEKGGPAIREFKERMDAAKIAMARCQDNAGKCSDEEKALQHEIKERSEEKVKAGAEVRNLEGSAKALEDDLRSVVSELEAHSSKAKGLQEKISDSDDELAGLEGKVRELDAKVKEAEERAHSLTLEKERAQERQARARAALTALEDELSQKEFDLKEATWRLNDASKTERASAGEIKSLTEQLFQKRNLERKLAQELGEVEDSIKRLNREYSTLTAEKEAADSVAKGFTRAVRGILEARDRGELKGVHGTIAQLAEVDPKYELALNVAAGARMQSIIVDDDEVAAKAIQHLKANNLGRATFLPLNKMLDGRPRGKAVMAVKEATGYAIDLISFDERYRAAFWYVFGDTVVVDTLDKARRLMGGVRLVTVGGELIEASGAMVGGASEGSGPKFGASSRGKLEETGEQLRKATELSEKLGQQMRQAREEGLAAETRLRELNSQGGSTEVKVAGIESSIKDLKARTLKINSERESLRADAEEAAKALQASEKGIVQAGAASAALVSERENARRRILILAPKEVAAALREAQAKVVDLSGRRSALEGNISTNNARIGMVRGRVQELDADIAGAKERAEQLKASALEWARKEEQARVELSALRKIEESMDREVSDLRLRKEAEGKGKARLEIEREQASMKADTSRDIIITFNTKLAAAEERRKEAEAEIAQINVPVALPLPTMEDIKSELAKAEALLESMGHVNMRAIEDYDEKNARHIELKGEMKRLEDQRRELLKLMLDLTERKKAELLRVHSAVNANFKAIYADLSQGGESDLILEDPDDPFKGGLVMKAKPRNGKVLRLEALSGGEKSLTALAFVFALQQYQPSPFYLLDEVDMFLDAVNSDMVAQRVAKSSSTAQFVQISLRRVTLNRADHIIGVTKPVGGISQVIMRPNLGDVKELAEELRLPEENEHRKGMGE